ncbi:hypothetical protein A5658_08005 [Mycobacterium sp. 1245111.1]|nr:hypothetical protein A5658_08005 [Mycobacterium sp. 1245111.1]
MVHQILKDASVASNELGTERIFWTFRNTGHVARYSVSLEVVGIHSGGGQFGDIAHLATGKRGAIVYETGDLLPWPIAISLIGKHPRIRTLNPAMLLVLRDYWFHRLASREYNHGSWMKGVR